MKNRYLAILHAAIACALLCVGAVATAAKSDSTDITGSSREGSYCTTLDGIKVDGSTGTPPQAPYNGGNWFANKAAVEAQFDREIIQTVATNPKQCVSVVKCTPGSVNNYSACPADYEGQQYTTTTTTCPNGIYKNPVVTTSGVNTSGCKPRTVTCVAGSTTSTETCASRFGSEYTGNLTVTTTTTCPAGKYGAPSVTTSTNTSQCSPRPVTCTAGSTQRVAACNTVYPGESGNLIWTDTTTCPSGPYGAPYTTSAITSPREWCWKPAVTCTPGSTNRQALCSTYYTGYLGYLTITDTTTCPSGSSGAPSTTSAITNTSGCYLPPAPPTRTVLSVSYSGLMSYIQDYRQVSFTLTNYGSVAATGLSVSRTGYPMSLNSQCGSSLAAGAQCTIYLSVSGMCFGANQNISVGVSVGASNADTTGSSSPSFPIGPSACEYG